MSPTATNPPVYLQFRGDWGMANMHRICGWLCQQLIARCGSDSRLAIWSGRGSMDNVAAVANGEVDIAVITPASFASMAYHGLGPYEGSAFPHLRALACLPHDDRLVFATTRTDISTVADLAVATPTPTLTAPADDGINHIGLAVNELLRRSGVSPELVRAGAGDLDTTELAMAWFDHIRRGQADVVAMEAIMLPQWHELCESTSLIFLPVASDALAGVESDFGWRAGILAAGRFAGQNADVTCLDFSDFALLTTTSLPEEIAYLIAELVWDTRASLEAQYRHLLPKRSPLTYPIPRKSVANAPIPLHDGASRYFAGSG